MPSAVSLQLSLLAHAQSGHAIDSLLPATVLTRCNIKISGRRCHHFQSFRRCYSSATTKSSLHNIKELSKQQKTFVFQSTTDNPYYNLAIEHYLLTNSAADSRILLFYTNRPCVVIGRNQNPWVECNLKVIQDGANGRTIDLVRRRSGGGTVFHDEGNLNFSVIVPNDQDFTRRKHSEMVVRALNKIHTLSAEYDSSEDIWVNDRHDITMSTMHNKGRSEFKVSGSAFKLTRGRALHHGTLLHSSPNLDNISKLLRSAGKEWIQAKGVESVRSPVMNLYNIQTPTERDELRSQITNEIIKEFLRFYKADVPIELVGDADCQEEVNPSIAQGIHELQTDEWRFEQTPRFEFASKDIDGKQLSFNVKDGSIEDIRLGSVDEPLEQRSQIGIRQKQKFHQIRDWCDVFHPETIDGELLATVAQVFPDLEKFLCKDASDASFSDKVVQHEKDRIVRRLDNGRIEKEEGLNTVEEVKK